MGKAKARKAVRRRPPERQPGAAAPPPPQGSKNADLSVLHCLDLFRNREHMTMKQLGVVLGCDDRQMERIQRTALDKIIAVLPEELTELIKPSSRR